jgi:type II secretory ATPase GspE/PulE/Tfp pilus assembly ATPase PilB-like protein
MPIQKYIRLIIQISTENNASDIHIEPQDNYYNIRIRINGLLELINNKINNNISNTSNITCQQIINALKIMAKLDISETRLPQDGRINYTNHIDKKNNKYTPLRISTIPTQFGEKMVLRLLNPTLRSFDFSKLGLLPDQIDILNNKIQNKQGLILITGPTGSGKTQLLYSILSKLNDPSKNIITIENPVEANINNITQIQTEDKINLNFSKILRSVLRQDPDIIMIGEIRDQETAQIAINAAETGHLVLASLHTTGTAETINRLIHMGIPYYHIADCLILVIACRLIRINKNNKITRTGVFEIMQINNSIRQLIYDKQSTQKIYKIACEQGMQTLNAVIASRVCCVDKKMHI